MRLGKRFRPRRGLLGAYLLLYGNGLLGKLNPLALTFSSAIRSYREALEELLTTTEMKLSLGPRQESRRSEQHQTSPDVDPIVANVGGAVAPVEGERASLR